MHSKRRYKICICLVILGELGSLKFSQKPYMYPDVGSDTSSVWSCCAPYSDVAKCRLFCQSCEITEKGIYVWFVSGGCDSIPRVSTVDG